VITRIRNAVAVALAILVTAATLGRVRVEWSGRPSAAHAEDDPGRAAATRTLGGGDRA
jgi:hypothetical protein